MVFVLDTLKRPLAPCSERRARHLLFKRKAAIFKYFPFTIILKRAVEDIQLPELRLKIDPGSKKTGLAIVDDKASKVVFAVELEHRGHKIHLAMEKRRIIRRSRRSRKTRYRQERFLDRKRKPSWFPPSLESRMANTTTWVNRLRCLCNITNLSYELVKFDLQKMVNPEISGVEYQQGELAGYELKEYLLEKFHRACTYCGETNIPLQVEHIIPRARGGTNRTSNLTIACKPCNQKKGNRTASEFGYPEIQKRALAPLKDASAVNSIRLELYRRLAGTGLPVEVGSGGLTKWNRVNRNLPKAHWVDAACVGVSTPDDLDIRIIPLSIKAAGHGHRRRCIIDKYGFPKTHRSSASSYAGFRTGDLVRAIVPSGKFRGVHVGRVVIRQRPAFCLNGFDVHSKYLRKLQMGC